MKNKEWVIWIDLDGVICAFDSSFVSQFGLNIRDYEKKHGKDKLHRDLDALGVSFWSDLKWEKDGKQLWNFVISKFEKVFILSSPGNYKDAVKGKEIWLNREMDAHWLGVFTKDKYKYAAPNGILIDDYQKNIDLWITKGNGIGILHTDANSTIERLEEILKKEV